MIPEALESGVLVRGTVVTERGQGTTIPRDLPLIHLRAGNLFMTRAMQELQENSENPIKHVLSMQTGRFEGRVIAPMPETMYFEKGGGGRDHLALKEVVVPWKS